MAKLTIEETQALLGAKKSIPVVDISEGAALHSARKTTFNKYPDATCFFCDNYYWIDASLPADSKRAAGRFPIGSGKREAEAWIDASNRITGAKND